MFLLPSEVGFLRYLGEAKVPLNEFSFPMERIADIQSQVRRTPTHLKYIYLNSLYFIQLESLIQKNYHLHQSARDGYRSYLQAYASYSLKGIFDVNSLDLVKVGKSFGFTVPPRVNMKMPDSEKTPSRKRHKKNIMK